MLPAFAKQEGADRNASSRLQASMFRNARDYTVAVTEQGLCGEKEKRKTNNDTSCIEGMSIQHPWNNWPVISYITHRPECTIIVLCNLRRARSD